MNTDRINALADLIEAQPHVDENAHEGFCMNRILHTCGTPSCIAGWAAWESLGRPQRLIDRDYKIEVEAATYLGFEVTPEDEADFSGHPLDKLFYPDGQLCRTATPQQAAKVLRHLAETGEVDWSVAK